MAAPGGALIKFCKCLACTATLLKSPWLKREQLLTSQALHSLQDITYIHCLYFTTYACSTHSVLVHVNFVKQLSDQTLLGILYLGSPVLYWASP